MTAFNNKKSLGIFSLTSCEGCQFELLSHYDLFSKLLGFYHVETFRLGQDSNDYNAIDVALIEGSPEGDEQIELIKKIRKAAKIVIAIGSCAISGGIQSQRNHLSGKLISRGKVKTLFDYIRIDYYIPGCPIRQSELISCLVDVYYGRVFNLPQYSVCSECKLNENNCLIKSGRPCLGPITRGGCNSICTNNNEACFGCREPIENANLLKIRELFRPILGDDELDNWLTIYGNREKKMIE